MAGLGPVHFALLSSLCSLEFVPRMDRRSRGGKNIVRTAPRQIAIPALRFREG